MMRVLSFLAFDFGTRRIGVATGNTLLRQAQGLQTLSLQGDALLTAIERLIKDWQPDALVVGVPFHPDGAEHQNTLLARRFARQLQSRFGLCVHEVDERYSTTEAQASGAQDLDAASAAIILSQYLQSLPKGPPEPLDDLPRVSVMSRPMSPNAIHPTQPTPPTHPIDAELLYTQVRDALASLITTDTLLVGIWSGGAWVAERLHRDLRLPGECGVISSTLHRDDFGSRGLAGSDATHLPIAIEGRHVVLVDDVIFTGRTIRAVINELFDFGRPARVSLVALADRGGRELPIQPDFVAARVSLAAHQKLALTRNAEGQFVFSFKEAL